MAKRPSTLQRILCFKAQLSVTVHAHLTTILAIFTHNGKYHVTYFTYIQRKIAQMCLLFIKMLPIWVCFVYAIKLYTIQNIETSILCYLNANGFLSQRAKTQPCLIWSKTKIKTRITMVWWTACRWKRENDTWCPLVGAKTVGRNARCTACLVVTLNLLKKMAR